MPETPNKQAIEQADFDKYIREADLKALEDYRKGSAPAPILYKQEGQLSQIEDSGQPFLFVASEESQDRLGDVITTAGWQLKNFQRNPVFLYGHDQNIPPIGNVPKIWVEGKQLLATVMFDNEDDFARQVKGKYQRKFMKAVSVGFRALDYEERQMDPTGADVSGGILFKKQELVEISAVPVPAHPAALMKMYGMRKTISLASTEYEKRFAEMEAQIKAFTNPAPAVVEQQEEDIDVIGAFNKVFKL